MPLCHPGADWLKRHQQGDALGLGLKWEDYQSGESYFKTLLPSLPWAWTSKFFILIWVLFYSLADENEVCHILAVFPTPCLFLYFLSLKCFFTSQGSSLPTWVASCLLCLSPTPTYVSAHLSTHWSIHWSIVWLINWSNYPSIYPSTYPFNQISIHQIFSGCLLWATHREYTI